MCNQVDNITKQSNFPLRSSLPPHHAFCEPTVLLGGYTELCLRDERMVYTYNRQVLLLDIACPIRLFKWTDIYCSCLEGVWYYSHSVRMTLQWFLLPLCNLLYHTAAWLARWWRPSD